MSEKLLKNGGTVKCFGDQLKNKYCKQSDGHLWNMASNIFIFKLCQKKKEQGKWVSDLQLWTFTQEKKGAIFLPSKIWEHVISIYQPEVMMK